MLPFRHIIFPIDYSDPCRAAVPYVRDMVARFSSDLTLIHASGLGLEAWGYGDMAIADTEWREQMRRCAEPKLREFADEAFPGQRVELIAEEGDAGSVIHKVVQHRGADLVMMPTHGHGPVRRLLLGSVTTKVLHDISAAVWTAGLAALAEYPHRIPYKQVLCALENDDESEAVLKAAVAMANCYRGELSLAHVVETPPVSPDIDFTPYKQDLIDSTDHWLRGMKRTLSLDVPHAVIDAPGAADGIRKAAIERKADLIVTGRGHAQRTVSRIWSRLYPIIREAPCPVLSV